MAVIISGKERALRLKEIARSFNNASRRCSIIQRQADQLIAEGQAPTAISTQINALLAELEDEVAAIIVQAETISYVYQERVKIGTPHELDFVAIDAADPIYANYGTIRINAARESYVDAFNVFQVNMNGGDVVNIVDADDDENINSWRIGVQPAILHGPTQFTNTDFSSVWAITDWTVLAGVADHDTGNTTALSYPAVSRAYNQTGPYLLSFTVTGCSAGSVTAQWATTGNSRTVDANGTYEVVVDYDTSDPIAFTPTSDFNGAISLPSLVPFTGIVFSGGLGADEAQDRKLDMVLSERFT